MGKAKIVITGEASKPPKIKEDKTVDLIIKVDMSTVVPKGLKSLGQSICLVHVGSRTWKKVAGDVKDDSFYIIQGEVKSNVNSKSVPFLEVVAFDIALKPETAQPKEEKEPPKEKKTKEVEVVERQKKEVKAETEQKKKLEPTKKEVQEQKDVTVSKKKKKNNNKIRTDYTFKDWYTPDEIKYVSYKELVLIERTHLETPELKLRGALKWISEKKTISKPLAVRPVQNNKYALVVGLKNYMVAKVFELEKIPIVVKNMTYEEFINKYAVEKKNHLTLTLR